MNEHARIPKQALMQYGLLATPLAFAGMPLYIHAPDFYTAQFGAPLATIGVILLLLRCFDAIQDPIIGRLSDQFANQRLGMMTAAALLLIASFYGLFNPHTNHLILWFTISMLCATTAFSIISINLNTIGGLWRQDPFEKTRITTHREIFGLVGLLLAVVLPATLMQSMPPTQAFSWIAMILAVIMMAAIIVFIRWYRRHPTPDTSTLHQQISLFNTIKNLPTATRRFFTIYAISMLASSLPALLVLFFIRDRLGAEDLTGLFLLLYFIAGIAGMPLWQSISKRKGKINTWMLAMLLAIASFVWAFLLGAGDVWQYGVICVLSGIAFGADLALPPSILADHIHAHDSEHNAAMQFGLFTFLAKAALALASFIGLSLLDVAAFKPDSDNTPSALLMLSALYALLPCIIKLFSVFLLTQSDLSGAHHEKTCHTHHHRSSDHA